ncbi:family 43 glycosylhydrolase [Mangrovibacterium sp.]|uniref:family 43 glycosylhydrolase n=1 Tax=Mangrovibacterium sp. TaxID=1961364 RepID=UPI0035652AE5
MTRLVMWLLLAVGPYSAYAWQGMSTPKLHVDGRYLKDTHGNIVNLHGVAMTPSPWFNGGAYGQWRWNNYDVQGCLEYNNSVMDCFTDTTQGWFMSYVRLHIDPYWSNTPGQSTTGENDISAFNYERFKRYLDEVIVPLCEHAKSRGLYIILRPPGVCPELIEVDGEYHRYLLKVWDYISQHSYFKNADHIMFELANEPVRIVDTNGIEGSNTQSHFDALKNFFQEIVDGIRANGSDNILWIPGTGYQSQYKGYAINPVEGENIGYAVHIYPGYWGGLDEYNYFQAQWDENVKPVADLAPIVVTEIDWTPDGEGSWGQGSTGVAGGNGFGANFNKITKESGNVGWNLLSPENLIYNGEPTNWTLAYEGNPETCSKPSYEWVKEYAKVDYPRADFTYQSSADNGDGTYTNPLIFADFPDPDVIRVGDVYYMVSTTMHIFPGATILKSYDLVNWEYCSNPLEKIESTDCYNLESCNRYGHGQWATSLKYNNGRYYLLFTTLEEGSYLLAATDPEGPWTKKKLSGTFYDPGLFFDDDGKTYVVYGINTLKVAELDADFEIVAGSEQEVFNYTVKEGLEGSHLYKINGYYYIYGTYGGWPAYQVALRSANIYGPYEEKLLLNDDNIHQGALIETQTGEWWTILFYDKGAFGRLPNLQPITWVNNWPEIGVDGKGVTTYTKPNVGREYPKTILPTTDNFRNYQLNMQWGWNHNVDDSKWSLTEHPDYLRLKTVNVVDSLIRAKNTLTQRIFGYPEDLSHSYGTIKMNIENMQEGDVAGLAVFQDPYAYIGVKVENGQKVLIQMNDAVRTTGEVIADTVVYLRAIVNYTNSKASFYYSLDNETYAKFGTDLDMKFNLSVFTGNKFCLFNFATEQIGGYVDFDWFTTEPTFAEDLFYDNSFVGYSEDQLMLTDLIVDGGQIQLLTGGMSTFKVTAVYASGRTKDVTLSSTYENSNPGIVEIVNGNILANADGEATISVTYKGELGNSITTYFNVNSSTFPLTDEMFDPSIWETGSFDETTGSLITGQYGFGGWQYSAGIDVSDYKYLVVKLVSPGACSASFRLFDTNSYWSSPASYDLTGKTIHVVNLSGMTNGDGGTVDPSHLYIIGFWSIGGCSIEIENVYLSNTDDYFPTAIDEVSLQKYDENKTVNVYSITGIKLRTDVSRKNATKGLPAGVYIVGREKVVETGSWL